MAKLLFGCGYLGQRVGRCWLANGNKVYAVTRSNDRGAELQRQGFQPLVADIMQPMSLPDLDDLGIEAVLFAVGFDRSGSQTIRDVYVNGMAHVLQQLPSSIRRFVYISSTGVYGQTDGKWVDENSECQPVSPGGAACLEAEQLLFSSRFKDRAVVLRLAGIYGPGRVPRQAALMAGDPIPSARDGFLNLIHVDDAATAVVAASNAGSTSPLMLVSDGSPVVREEYFREMARLIGAPAVRFVEPAATAPRSNRSASNKRVSNRRLLDQLSIALEYPSYREGLSMILGGSDDR